MWDWTKKGSLSSLEVEFRRFPGEEITQNRPDHHDNGEIDEILLGWGEQGGKDVSCNEKFEPEDDLISKFPSDLVVVKRWF